MQIKVEYRSGSQSSHLHLPKIGPVVARVLRCQDLFQGSLNLYAAMPIHFPDPARVLCAGEEWLFVPVIIEEKAVGLAARRPPPEAIEFIEVFACDKLAPRLGLELHDEVTIRLLSGRYLSLAA